MARRGACRSGPGGVAMFLSLRAKTRARVAIVGVLATLVGLLVVAGSPRAAADTTALTDDRSVGATTSWWTYSNITASQLSSNLSANGARLTELEPYDVA